MKVTSELKKYIKRSFDEKKEKTRQEIKQKADDAYDAKLKEMEESDEFKALKEAYHVFKDKFYDEKYDSKTSKESWYLRFFDEYEEASYFIRKSYNFYDSEQTKEIHLACDELDKQCEKVLIKLTYEKDLDAVKELLAEYDIYL